MMMFPRDICVPALSAESLLSRRPLFATPGVWGRPTPAAICNDLCLCPGLQSVLRASWAGPDSCEGTLRGARHDVITGRAASEVSSEQE